MGKEQKYVDTLRTVYPDLGISSAEINQDGQYNDVLIVNESLVFRFAKVHEAIETLRREVTILHHLHGQITLPIPNPAYINIDSKIIGEVFVGYSMIPGIPLWYENFQKITALDVRQRMAVQLATFLKELHHVSVNEIPFKLRISDTPQSWKEMYAQIRQKLYSFMRPDARQEITEHFENFFLNIDQYKFSLRLRHGDFGTGNILFNPKTHSIAGVIDFGGVGLGDPASDFAGLYISFGEEFYRNCYSVYPEMEHALERVKFYIGTFALQEALFGYENDDQDAFNAGMEIYV